MRFAGRFLTKHRIKGDQLENVNRLEPKLCCDPGYGVIADETEVFLPQMKQWHRRAAPVLVRVARDRRIHFPLQLGGDTRVRRVHDSAMSNWTTCSPWTAPCRL